MAHPLVQVAGGDQFRKVRDAPSGGGSRSTPQRSQRGTENMRGDLAPSPGQATQRVNQFIRDADDRHQLDGEQDHFFGEHLR